jgi:hypothetical protein
MAINCSFYVILRATGVPQQCPGFEVPTSATVRVLAHNNQPTGNAGIVQVAESYDKGAQGDVLTPGNEKLYPVKSTAQIFITGTAGDGVLVTVKK